MLDFLDQAIEKDNLRKSIFLHSDDPRLASNEEYSPWSTGENNHFQFSEQSPENFEESYNFIQSIPSATQLRQLLYF